MGFFRGIFSDLHQKEFLEMTRACNNMKLQRGVTCHKNNFFEVCGNIFVNSALIIWYYCTVYDLKSFAVRFTESYRIFNFQFSKLLILLFTR